VSELTLTIIKLGFLAVLWLFVLSTVSVIRTDLFGARTPNTGKARKQPKNKSPKSPRKPKGAPAMVMVVQGANAGFHLPLGGAPLTIGRGNDVEIFVDDEYVSTRHAVLRPHDNRWYVEDLGSTNGTFVGESRIHGPTPVGFGTPFRVGKTVLELRK
jgi:pSer/pThr/pTyr-binding forkhead associated (FHA) protein